MRICRMRVCHLQNPLGFRLDAPTFSWGVEDARGTKAAASRIRVTLGDVVVADTGWAQLDSMAAQVDGLSLAARTRYAWTVSVRSDAGEEATSRAAWFETGKMGEPWSASWLAYSGKGATRHPVFFADLPLAGRVESARLYACGLGTYDASINGMRVGDEYLAPGTCAYDQWLQAQTYDVTDQLRASGDVARLSFAMGNGWWKGRFGFFPTDRGFYGDDWRLIAELHVSYEDGSHEVLSTGDGWMVTLGSTTFSNIYDGQHVDGTLPVAEPVPAALLGEEDASAATARLGDRLSLPVRIRERLPATIVDTPSGDLVLDLGQNIAGTFRLHVHEPRGTKVTVQLGELLQGGEFYNRNLRSAKQEFVYVSDGEGHVLEPRFTYYGYRYARIEGMQSFVPADFEGLALCSDFEETGTLSTGHALVNRLVENARWGMRDNFVDTPTDCPQRDERMGWTGDAQIFSTTALYLADQAAFYRKYAYDMAMEAKKRDGAAPLAAPAFMLDGAACAVWGDATCIIPWESYRFSGDPQILAEHYDAMRAWVDYVERTDGDDHGWARAAQFGDWLALDGPKGGRSGRTDAGFIAYLYWWNSSRIVAKSARILGRADEAAHYDGLAERIGAWINAEYYSANGRCAVNTQTAYVLSIAFGFGSRELAAQGLRRELAYQDDKLVTGFVGTRHLLGALCAAGMPSKAYELLTYEGYPGWLREVVLGATTIWERWNSLDDGGRITGIDMNSMNHYSYGSVVGWLFGWAAGLRPIDEAPGFRRAVVAPTPSWRLGRLECTHACPAGTWRVAWSCVDETHLHVELDVPFGCTAEVTLPSAPEGAYEDLGGHVLAAGTYAVEYETTSPLRRVPSVDWPLSRLLASSDTEAVVRAHAKPDFVPPEDVAGKSFRELAGVLGRGRKPLDNEAYEACVREFAALAEPGPTD
jgi:alpha-L-rhamnosidase